MLGHVPVEQVLVLHFVEAHGLVQYLKAEKTKALIVWRSLESSDVFRHLQNALIVTICFRLCGKF